MAPQQQEQQEHDPLSDMVVTILPFASSSNGPVCIWFRATRCTSSETLHYFDHQCMITIWPPVYQSLDVVFTRYKEGVLYIARRIS